MTIQKTRSPPNHITWLLSKNTWVPCTRDTHSDLLSSCYSFISCWWKSSNSEEEYAIPCPLDPIFLSLGSGHIRLELMKFGIVDQETVYFRTDHVTLCGGAPAVCIAIFLLCLPSFFTSIFLLLLPYTVPHALLERVDRADSGTLLHCAFACVLC